jgi:hypothetical protein
MPWCFLFPAVIHRLRARPSSNQSRFLIKDILAGSSHHTFGLYFVAAAAVA